MIIKLCLTRRHKGRKVLIFLCALCVFVFNNISLSGVENVLPDNISNAHCFTAPEAVTFNVREVARTEPVVSTVTNPVCGDIDGDGEIEILVMNLIPSTSYYYGSYSDAILVYGFNTGNNELYLKYKISVPLNDNLTFSPLAIAKVDSNPYASIFYTSSAYGTLAKYDFNGTDYTETWTVSYTINGHYAVVSPTITDIMGNGRTQVCILDKVFDTKTGALLANGNFIGDNGYLSSYSFGRFGHGNTLQQVRASAFESMMVAVDIDDDGIKELIGGDCVYAVNLTNFDGIAGNSFTLKQRARNAAHPEIGDGGTAIADINNDGQLEVIVSGPRANGFNTSNYGMLYVYNPRTGEVIHTNNINNIPRNNRVFGPSRPFVGDVDGDGYPEICLTGEFVLQTYKYNNHAKRLDLVWSLPTSDFSGSTTLTMFDFAQDGKARLVYRDQESLRIIDASTNPPTIEVRVEGIYSPTVNEFPIVADINGDGAVEIILTGSPFEDWNLWPPNWSGELRIYASDGKPWAPARSVWNQSAYNVLNVNEDLTIPPNLLSPATVFPGKDGVLGTSDDVRPFNNFLQQQTLLNRNGNPLWVVPDYMLQPGWEIQVNDDNSATVRFCVKNIGNANGIPPFGISLYKNRRNPANLLANQFFDVVPAVEEEICYELTVDHFEKIEGIDASEFVLAVNDNGKAEYIIPECDFTNNPKDVDERDFPVAHPESAVICAGESVEFNIGEKSKIPAGTTFTRLRNPMYGIWQDVGNGVMRYANSTPYTSETLKDTLTFELRKGDFFSRANIVITIHPVPVVSITGESVINVPETTTLSPTTGGTWSSSNPKIASVSANGIVTGLDKGEVTFTFTNTLTGCSATTDVITVLSAFYAKNDTVEVVSCGNVNVTIPILNNDSIMNDGGCTKPTVTILTHPTLSEAQASIILNELNYRAIQLFDNYEADQLRDSVQYEVSCGLVKRNAWVHIFIQKDDQNAIELSLHPEKSVLCIHDQPLELTATIINTKITDTNIVWNWSPPLSSHENTAWYVPSRATTDSVMVTATDQITKCVSWGMFYITVQDSVRITIAPDNQYICQDGEKEIALTAKVETGNPSEIVWYDGEKTLIQPDSTSVKWGVIPVDSARYWAYATDSVCGNSPYAYTTVYVTNKIYLLLETDTTKVQIGDNITLTVTPTNNEHGTYRWYDAFTGKPLGETIVNTFTYTPDREGNFAFFVQTDNGYCPEAISNEVDILVTNFFIIPNIITPYNRNRMNDTFMTPREDRPGYRVEIYNRYQQKVFEGNNGWDGTYRGRLAEPGTYFYRLFMNGRIFRGTVEVAKF